MEIDGPRSMQAGAEDLSVLHVGDRPGFLEDIADTGIDVTTVQTPDDARERLAKNGVDCVVSHYDLPGTDGVEFLAGVRERRPGLPLLLVAEEVDREVVEAAVAVGVTDCLDPARVACRGDLLARRVHDAASARRVSETDLVENTERLARVGGWHLDVNSGQFRATPGCRRLHGLEDQPGGMDRLVECYHPGDQQTLRTALVRAKETTDQVIVVTDEAAIETVPTAEGTGGQVYLPELRLRPDTAPDRVVEGRIESVTSDGEVIAIRGAVSDATDRKRREAEVRRYERVADDLPVGLFRATPDGEFASVNQTLVDMLGADSEVDLHGTGTDDLFCGEEVEAEGLRDWLDRDAKVQTDPLEIETLDGETRWVELTLSPAERDGVRYVDGVVRDVTERRRRVRQLERSERRYRTLAENLPNGAVLVFDSDLHYRFVHGEMFSEIEGDPDEYRGAHITEVFQGEVLETKREMYEATLEGNPQQTEMRFRGLTYEVYTVPVRDEDGDVYAGIVMTQNVTERTEREQHLQRARERMQFALEATDSYVYETDLETGEETRYGAFERIHGVDPATVPTSEAFFERCVHPDDREEIKERHSVETLLDQSGTVTGEYRTERADGDVRWIHTEADVRTGPEGDPEQLVGLSTDVTERKRREKELQRQNERLEQFAGTVSHDLNTPLSVAYGHLELLRNDHDSEHVERALEALDRSTTLVSDLLTLARSTETVDSGNPVNLAAVVERVWRGIDSTDVSLVTETARTVRANETLLRQLLTNLLRNAVEHGVPRSRAEIPGNAVGQGGEDLTVTVGDLPGDGFYVADDGPGIPPTERDDAFESGYSTGQGSTGLGLAIVREIVSAHGWEVTVTESNDGGARFEVTGVETVATDTGGIEERLEQIDRQARTIYETLERGPQSIPELAAECDLSPSAVCRQLERLERHDLVDDRTRVAEDGNAYLVYRQSGRTAPESSPEDEDHAPG